MGMTIGEAIRYYEDKNVVLTEEEALANTIAIATMRKYQKIEEIVDKWNWGIYDDDGLSHTEVMDLVSEVVEDGLHS